MFLATQHWYTFLMLTCYLIIAIACVLSGKVDILTYSLEILYRVDVSLKVNLIADLTKISFH